MSENEMTGKPAFYSVLLDSMKKSARELGYMLTVHGSYHDDMDVIAVAWTEDARSETDLVLAIQECLGETAWKSHNINTRETKPHGRIAYSLGIVGSWRIDLSIIPPSQKQEEGDESRSHRSLTGSGRENNRWSIGS